MKQRIFACLLLLVSTGLVACSGQQEEPVRVPPQPAPMEESRPQTAVANASNKFTGNLRSLNGSGVRGDVVIVAQGRRVSVRISARGLVSGRYHPAIHGFPDTRLSQGPPVSASVTASELERFTGPELIALAPFAVPGTATTARYVSRIDGRTAYPLDVRAIVILGPSGSGGPVPLAYSLLKPAELGDGGIGGPGGSGAAGGQSGMGSAGMGAPSAGAGTGAGAAGSTTGPSQGSGAQGGQSQGAGSAGTPQGD